MMLLVIGIVSVVLLNMILVTRHTTALARWVSWVGHGARDISVYTPELKYDMAELAGEFACRLSYVRISEIRL